MGLADYVADTDVVKFPGGEFAVRGLTMSDVISLYRTHKRDVDAAFSVLKEQGAENAADILSVLMNVAPGLVGPIIAIAADEPKLHTKAAKLPLQVQIDAFEKIGSLTFAGGGGLVGFMETVTRMVTGAVDQATLVNGSLAHAAQ